VSIIGDAERISRVSGSAHRVQEKELEEQNYDDVHRVLQQVPGVYVRDEDGLGLRPNIGLRGANSDRSAKITLMEDGVLMAPAPYSAPAAYYFPLTTRLTTVEVFKGPASIQYGPNTIGGALNMVTRSAPLRGHQGAIDTSWGSFNTAKAHAHYGWGNEYFGFVVEGIQLQTDGFKEIDFGGDSGFLKREAMMKMRLNSNPDAEVFHQLNLKLGWSTEVSNETYLGLTEADFDATPYRRYATSQLAEMAWERLQGKLDYTLSIGDNWEMKITGYHHRFSRAWEKLNGFNNNQVTFEDVLSDPTSSRNRTFYEILTGASPSLDDSEQLILGLNDRSYVSQGIQAKTQWRTSGRGWKNQLQVGARLHADYAKRNHSDRLVAVNDPQNPAGLLIIERDRQPTLQNKGETIALSGFIFDELRLGERWRVTPGVRLEYYDTKLAVLDASGQVIEGIDWALLPGIGGWYTLSDNWGLLAGVHRGFAPLSLSQTGRSDPEVSTNYELGTRWQDAKLRGEVIGFYNDYQNLVGTCTQSAGCEVDQLGEQFNAGSAQILGLEWMTQFQEQLGGWGLFNSALTYTYTRGRFVDSFKSGFTQWGEVEAGDALPYVPEHQLNFRISMSDSSERYGVGVSYTLVSPMLDSAGVFGDGDQLEIPTQHVLDANAYYKVIESLRLYVTVDNALNQAYRASNRPFGIRPGKPLLIQGGMRYQF
jgi:Fe(3+) dicitrate transport protein